MSFPASSETFASNDVRLLTASGETVEVHSLRSARPEAAKLLSERGLENVDVSYNMGWATLANGLLIMLQRPGPAISIVSLLFRTCISRPKHLGKSLLLLPRVIEVFWTLLRDRPDVVHAYWAHYPSMVVHLVQRFMPDVVTSISFSAYDIGRGFPVSGHVARRADFVRSLARFTAKEAAEEFDLDESRIAIIHDGVDLSLVPKATGSGRVPRRVLSAGRLFAAKGMDRVITAFASLYARYPDATLRLLGTGPERERLTALARELGVSSAVEFAGHVSQTDVLSEMQQAEVFLFLSSSERLPNVVKEAMLSGCVCIVSRTGGIDELVEDGVSGFIVDHDDHDRIVATAAAIFDHEVDAKQMTMAAITRIRSDFDARASVARYIEGWRGRLHTPTGQS